MVRLLAAWGFLEELEPKAAARYIAAVAKGIVTAIADERQAIERERIHGAARA
jgi:hypothetical protein